MEKPEQIRHEGIDTQVTNGARWSLANEQTRHEGVNARAASPAQWSVASGSPAVKGSIPEEHCQMEPSERADPLGGSMLDIVVLSRRGLRQSRPPLDRRGFC